MATDAHPPMADDDIPIREVQTATLRRHGSRSVKVSITEAIREAGLEDGGSFRFDPTAYDELGMVPAIGRRETVDGRRSENRLTRNIRKEGANNTLRLVIPEPVLETLGYDIDEVDWEDPPEVTVWAGPELLAFDRPAARTVTVDRDPDSGGE